MILISSCLAGLKVRYDGSHCLHSTLEKLIQQNRAMTVCPELLGGCMVPRPSAEIVGGNGDDVWDGIARVIETTGKDVTDEYMDGALATLKIAKMNCVALVVLKENSPSCGSTYVYNGKFNGQKVEGKGVTASLLIKHGIQVLSEEAFVTQYLL